MLIFTAYLWEAKIVIVLSILLIMQLQKLAHAQAVFQAALFSTHLSSCNAASRMNTKLDHWNGD